MLIASCSSAVHCRAWADLFDDALDALSNDNLQAASLDHLGQALRGGLAAGYPQYTPGPHPPARLRHLHTLRLLQLRPGPGRQPRRHARPLRRHRRHPDHRHQPHRRRHQPAAHGRAVLRRPHHVRHRQVPPGPGERDHPVQGPVVLAGRDPADRARRQAQAARRDRVRRRPAQERHDHRPGAGRLPGQHRGRRHRPRPARLRGRQLPAHRRHPDPGRRRRRDQGLRHRPAGRGGGARRRRRRHRPGHPRPPGSACTTSTSSSASRWSTRSATR